MGLVIGEGSFKTPKAVCHLVCLAMGSSEIFHLFQQLKRYGCMSHAFVYGAVDVDKTFNDFFSKTAFIHTCAINYTAKTSLLHLSISGKHFKPNPNSIE